MNDARLLADLRQLATMGGTPEGGVSRPAYGDEDLRARKHVQEMMRAARLSVAVDAAGNTIASRPGTEPGLKPIMIGSHTDSVPNGGRFDGSLGTLAALEVARVIVEQGIELRHPLEVVDFQNEEGGLIGSKAMAGRLPQSDLALTAVSGRKIGDGIRLLGGNPDRIGEAARAPGSIAAYLELHIEQGRVLERASANIGVVEGIVGIRYWEVTFEGVATHAGTTPMPDRHDALLAAARFVEAVNTTVLATPGRSVGTVGRLAVFPGAPNVIPGRVVLTLELRDLEVAKIEALYVRVEAEAHRIAAANGTKVTLVPTLSNEPAPTDSRVREAVSGAATALGLKPYGMPSGAGHDAQNMTVLGPSGLLFVPSVNGISHSPLEMTVDEDVVNGANVLLGAVLRMDLVL